MPVERPENPLQMLPVVILKYVQCQQTFVIIIRLQQPFVIIIRLQKCN